MNETKQGVSQQILERLEMRYKGALPANAERFDGQLSGASMLHNALSAEARAVLAEYDERLNDISEENDEKRRIVRYQIQAVRLAFERLGLDLESEDQS